MKDFLGNELSINDIILCATRRNNDLKLGKITNFNITTNQERIEYISLYNVDGFWHKFSLRKTYISSHKVIKYFGPIKQIVD